MEVRFSDLKSQYLSIKDEMDEAIASVIRDSAFVGGKYVPEFEKNFADYLGVKRCVGVGNGTDAIFVVLKALGIGPGDEVIVPANSFIATSEPVTLTGARPVFVDCDPKTYNIDVGLIEKAITPKTKVIMPVHLYGQPADVDPILAMARKRNIHVIEDAAQAHGAVYKGKKAGTFGVAATFSFFPGKNLGAYGDAGAIVTNDDDLAGKMRMFANHGRKEKYFHETEGVNSRLDGLQAAVLSVKLKHLDKWVERRREVAARYDNALRGAVPTPKVLDGVAHAYHLYVIKVKNRARLQQKLQDAGISTGVHYPFPLPFLPAYGYLNHKPEDFPAAHSLSGEILSIPMHEGLGDDQVDYVVEKLKESL